VELVNAAVAGYSSEQILRYLDLRGWSYNPDLVLVYCGNNDASVSGFLSDRELMTQQKLKAARRLAANSALYRLMRSLIEGSRSTEQTPPDNQPLVVRVTPDQFSENLETIATQCAERSCPLVIMQPAVPLLWPAGLQFKVFQTVTGESGSLILPEPMRRAFGRPMKYCFDWDEIAERYGDGDPFTRSVYGSAYVDSMAPSEAIRDYIAQVTADPDDAIAANNLGVSYFDDGHPDTAAAWIARGRQQFGHQNPVPQDFATSASHSVFFYNHGIARLSAARSEMDSTRALDLLDSALQRDYFSLRIKRTYADKIEALPLAFDGGVWVLDVAAALAVDDDKPLAIEAMFIDHCHPTARGHYRMAQALRHLITEQVLPE
jgi:lysophospholipase L1-like esterase